MSDPMNNPATQALNEALAAAFARGDYARLAEFYAPDAMLLPPRGQAVQGRDSINAFWLSFANRFSSIVFTTADVRLIGDDVARETGTYTATPNDQQVPGQGKYLFLWERINGEWQIESSIWTRNPDGRGGQGGGGQGGGQGQGGRGGIGMPGGGRGPQGAGGGGRGGMGGGGRPPGQQGQPGPRRGGANYEQSAGLYSDLEG